MLVIDVLGPIELALADEQELRSDHGLVPNIYVSQYNLLSTPSSDPCIGNAAQTVRVYALSIRAYERSA